MLRGIIIAYCIAGCVPWSEEHLAPAAALLAPHGASVRRLAPAIGAEVIGLSLTDALSSGLLSRHNELARGLELLMAHAGFLVFRGQGMLSGDEQVEVSSLFGAGEMHSTHGVHKKARDD